MTQSTSEGRGLTNQHMKKVRRSGGTERGSRVSGRAALKR